MTKITKKVDLKNCYLKKRCLSDGTKNKPKIKIQIEGQYCEIIKFTLTTMAAIRSIF